MTSEIVVVTGSLGGIGAAIVKRLGGAGLSVIGIDRRPGHSSGRYRHFDYDLLMAAGEPRERQRLAASLADAQRDLGGGRVIGLVNNAAEQVVGAAIDLDVADFRRSMDINVIAPLVLAQCLYPQLSDCDGAIINISSIHARLTKSGFSAYSISKAALSGLSRALAVEWGRRVRVITVELAAVATPMLEAGFAGRAAARAQLDDAHPSGAIGEAEQVADWVYQFILSRFPFANGAVLRLDGGMSFRLFDPD